jgi:hypothetical protein
MELRYLRLLPLPLVLLTLALPVRGDAPVPADDLKALDRDDAAADAAVASGDVPGALRYFDYFGHEQEDFARASVEYRVARQKLREAVRGAFGRREWMRAASALGVPPLPRGEDGAQPSLRRDGNVLYVKVPGGANEVPYVKVDGVWKVSVRDVLITALRARFGPAVEYEEADLFVLAGKMGRVLRGRARQLSALAEDVRAKRVASPEELREAVDRIRRPSQPEASREP